MPPAEAPGRLAPWAATPLSGTPRAEAAGGAGAALVPVRDGAAPPALQASSRPAPNRLSVVAATLLRVGRPGRRAPWPPQRCAMLTPFVLTPGARVLVAHRTPATPAG